MLNSLEYGVRCEVTTSDGQVVTGAFLGIEVAHGDMSILIESPASTHSVPLESVASTSGLPAAL